MLGAGIGISVFASLSSMSLFEKSRYVKAQTALLLMLSVALFGMTLAEVYETEVEILNLLLILCVFPACFAGMENLANALILIVVQLGSVGIYLGISYYMEILDAEHVFGVLKVLSSGVELITQGACSYLLILGYTYIPEIMVYPFINHFFKKSNLENQHYSIERAKSNISFQYTCRGLPTPKYELNNLKVIEREREIIEYKLEKLYRNIYDNKTLQIASVSMAFIFICVGFWVLSLLTGVLVEDLVISKCGLSCGFDAKSRISTLISSFELAFFAMSGIFYLATCLFGFYWCFHESSKEISASLLLGLSLTSACCSFPVQSIHSFFNSTHIPGPLRLIQFFLHALTIALTFSYFIYWHFFKCKNR